MQRTSSELQQEFCGLWNELVHTAREGADVQIRLVSTEILGHIRRNYIAFHENMDPTIPTAFFESNDHDPILYHATAYPLCSVQSHHPVPMHSASQNPEMTTNMTVTQDIAIPPATPSAILPAAHLV
ncbi:hypothetical protein H4582DRAFT_2061062 [Lactarius indigo]|nr:hypothetical protein H4582DRAFT_2061062 [Lactarius indigo]